MKIKVLLVLSLMALCSGAQAMQESSKNNQQPIPPTSSYLFRKTVKGTLSFSAGSMLLVTSPSALLASVIAPMWFTNLGTGEIPRWTVILPLYALASTAGGYALLKEGGQELHSVAKELQMRNNGAPSQRTSLCSRKVAVGGAALMIVAGVVPLAWAIRK